MRVQVCGRSTKSCISYFCPRKKFCCWNLGDVANTCGLFDPANMKASSSLNLILFSQRMALLLVYDSLVEQVELYEKRSARIYSGSANKLITVIPLKMPD